MKKGTLVFDVKTIKKEYATDKKFMTWLKKNFTTLDELRACRRSFLAANEHTLAEVIFKQMKAVCRAPKPSPEKEETDVEPTLEKE